MIKSSSVKKSMKNKKYKNQIRCMVFLILAFIGISAFAGNGTDLLAGTSDDLVSTLTGEGKKYLYISEVLVGTIGFIKTRNPAIFIGIIILSVGFNVLLGIAGVTS